MMTWLHQHHRGRVPPVDTNFRMNVTTNIDAIIKRTETMACKAEREGIIIRKKLYALKTKDKGLIVKSSGVNPYKLTYANFKELLENKTVEVQTNTFNVDWSKVKINYLPRIVKLKGIYMQDHKVASDDPPVPPHP